MKYIILFVSFVSLCFAQTPFLLTGIKNVYPVAEVYTSQVPMSYRDKITKKIDDFVNEMGISTEGFSDRPLAIVVTRIAVGKSLVLQVQLMMGEEVKRLDDSEEVFALTYQKTDIIEVENLDVDLMDSVEYLLEDFKEQYIEDNE